MTLPLELVQLSDVRGDGGSVLRYASTNLWVPKTLCETLQAAGGEVA